MPRVAPRDALEAQRQRRANPHHERPSRPAEREQVGEDLGRGAGRLDAHALMHPQRLRDERVDPAYAVGRELRRD